MNSVELVKKLCKEKKIPISRLERDLGYSNGYIGQLRKGVFPTDRLVEIANYLSVPVEYLLGTEKEKASTPVSERGQRMRSMSRLEAAELTEEEDAQIDELIAWYLKSKGKDK